MSTQSPDEWPDELFHYTNINGLKGILETQTLWATHYAYLNDSQELKHFFEDGLFLKEMCGVCKEACNQNRDNHKLKEKINQKGGIESFVRESVKELLLTLKELLIGKDSSGEGLAEPYVACFSTSTDKNVMEHGLLSQWYQYGRDQEYAIVFNTQKLKALVAAFGNEIRREQDAWHCMIGHVVYSSEKKRFIREFDTHLTNIKNFYFDLWTGQDIEQIPELNHVFFDLVLCACRYKHWGFSEEKEIRIVIAPINKSMEKIYQTENCPFTRMPIHLRTDKAIPYIKLFEKLKSQPNPMKLLPITRIIVGPSPSAEEKSKRVRSVEIFLEQLGLDDIKVTASDIPFLG